MGVHNHGRRIFVDLAYVGSVVQLAYHEGRAGPGMAQQRTADVLLAHRVLQPTGNNQSEAKKGIVEKKLLTSSCRLKLVGISSHMSKAVNY